MSAAAYVADPNEVWRARGISIRRQCASLPGHGHKYWLVETKQDFGIARSFRKKAAALVNNTVHRKRPASAKTWHARTLQKAARLGVFKFSACNFSLPHSFRQSRGLTESPTSASASLFSRSSRSSLCVSERASCSLASTSSFLIFPCGG